MDDLSPHHALPLSQLHDLMVSRHSCRAFLPEPLPRDLIAAMLTTAQRTASWSNTQPWWLHVVSGAPLEALRRDFWDRAGSAIPRAPEIEWPREHTGKHQERRRECGWGLYAAVGIQKGDRAASAAQARENFRFFGAPHVVLVTCEKSLGPSGIMDCGAWVYAFLLAAEAAGVGAVAQAALAGHPDIWRKHLSIPASRLILCGVSFGHEDRTHAANAFRTTRAPIAEVVDWVG